jgi:signal transduction histidine kinase
VVIGNVVLIEDVTEAKVMERSRDEFFAVASHELRTPLTAIRGNADMILEMYADKIVDKDMKEMLTDINSSSVRLIAVVNDFLEVSRLEQGRIEVKKEKFNIADVAGKVTRDLKEMINKKGLALQYVPPEIPLPPVVADKNRVEQILVNLVGNSAKFTKEGGITIELGVDGMFIRIRVSDTGVGISEHNQTLLFRKFQQAGEDMLARDVSQSTGLGLYICKLIVQNMGGQIGLERSELGKGSVFFFTIPIAQIDVR